ncbi:hypothetical protein HA402_001763 [Bradysia odoriphaga]|nr:hypothetical protein HA402_001763 [Bradysia odoriphaga]
MVLTKKFIYAQRVEGEPKETDFSLIEYDLPVALNNGEVFVEAIYHSVDPYMRVAMGNQPIGTTMIGGQIARVVESRNDLYPKDSIIFGQLGWQTHSIFNPVNNKDSIQTYVLPSFGELSVSLGLGALGMPGNCAFFGFLTVCKPRIGEVVVISGAAGAIGSLVGQIAKLKGCKVIGLTGSEDKCNRLINELNFDHAINYKTQNIPQALQQIAPDGIDCYFDNVGGTTSVEIIYQMKEFGRICVCGSISSHNFDASTVSPVRIVQPAFVTKQLVMEGIQAWQYADKWMEGIQQMLEWVTDGKIKCCETVTHGFESLPKAFINMMKGGNFGKAVVRST